MAVQANIGGSWKEVVGMHCKVNGNWKEVSSGYVNQNGIWREIYSAVDKDEVIAWNCETLDVLKTGSFATSAGITSTSVGIAADGKFNRAMSIGSSLEYTGRGVKAIQAATGFSFHNPRWTVAFWYCRTADSSQDSGSFFPIAGFLLNTGSSGRGPAYGFAFGTSRTGILLAGKNAGSSTAPSGFDGTSLGMDTPAGVWRYLAMVRSGASVLFFVDGALKATISARDVDTGLLQIGNVCDPGGTTYARNYWASKFDDVLVTDTAKWTADFAVPTRPLAGY